MSSARTRASAFTRTDLARLLRRHSIGLSLALAVAGGAAFGIHRASPAKHAAPAPASAAVVPQLPAGLFDFQPSDLRQNLVERLEDGQAPPATGVPDLEAEQRQTELQLTRAQDLADKYFHEIQTRDSTITQLNQAVASDRNNLAAVAQQLGLPKDELAPAPQAVAGSVGGFAPIDQGAISSAQAKAAPTTGKVTSAQDLAVRVNAYLKLPCPLPAGDPRCQQAETHARQEVS
ncbi:MAG: hypothetical protein JO247_22360, partial [Chloroflexi bacterium]|nr:hypothetical protein [Chloroflexota bacterium]